MKKNIKTYILLVVVAIIWGTIGYRIIASLSSGPEPAAAKGTVDFKPLPVQKKDTFSILADYRDPFLGTVSKKKKKKTKTVPTSKTPPVPEINVLYTGLIQDNDRNQQIFFVTIDGQQHLMGLKEEINGVRLLSGSNTWIKVRYNNKTRTIQLNQ